MKFKKIDARLGETVRINDSMSLRYEKFADDLLPVWHEIPSDGQMKNYEEGTFVSVTHDVWFVFNNGTWRMMTPSEHIEAYRQNYMA